MNASLLVGRAWQVGVSSLICALFAPWIVLGRVRQILIAAAVLDIPLQLDTNLGQLEDRAELGALGGFNVSITTVALVALYAGWLIEHVIGRPRPSHPLPATTLPLALYVAFAGLSLLTTWHAGLSLRELFLLAQTFLLYIYFVHTIRTRGDVQFVLVMLLCGLALEGAIMIALSSIGESVTVAGFTGRVDVYVDGRSSRVGGTIGAPNNAAAYLSMLLAPAVAVLMTDLGRWHRVLALVALAAGSLALIETRSRGGLLAAGASLAIVCFFMWRGRQLRWNAVFLLVVVLGCLIVMYRDVILDRFVEDDVGSAESRIPLMESAWGIISDQPVLGVGANSYTVALERYAAGSPVEWLYTVHNKYLLVWAETGLGGLAAFVWFLGAMLRQGWRRWRLRDPLLSPLALGFTAALLGHMAHMNVDLFSERPQVQLLWLVAALLGAMNRMPAGASGQTVS